MCHSLPLDSDRKTHILSRYVHNFANRVVRKKVNVWPTTILAGLAEAGQNFIVNLASTFLLNPVLQWIQEIEELMYLSSSWVYLNMQSGFELTGG